MTFDDGFQELHRYAFPLLREFSYTAVVFVATGHVGRAATWIERDMTEINARILPRLRLPASEVERHTEQLRSFSRRKLLSWDEIGEMHAYGIDFQSHSCTHPFFSTLDLPTIQRELEDSKAEIEERLHKTVHCIAYPYGDYHHPHLKNALERMGYTTAFCDDWTPERHKACNPYEVNRIPVGNDADPTYLRLCFSASFPWYRSLASFGRRFI
jgi:peptidoglycan/xylan/chitin deacetylase (PgdA/CDA1 family)